MDKLQALMEAHGERAVEFAVWEAVARLDAETRRSAELTLASGGLDGLGELFLAGPALDGLDAAQVGELLAAVEAGLGELAA